MISYQIMASPATSSASILCSKKPHILVRRITTTTRRPTFTITFTTTSSVTTATTTTSSRGRVAVMTKDLVTNKTTTTSSFINRGERISVWWRDGWRLISCADFGLGAQCAKRRNLSQKSSFSSSSSSSSSPSSSSPSSARSSSDMVSENKEEDRDNNDHHRSFSTHQQSTKLLTLPTILTLGRVAAIPLLITTFYGNSWWATSLTTSIFVVAAITDWLDGYLARKMRLGTPFGAFLDPVADKLMVAATLVLLCTRPLELSGFGEISWLLPIPSIAIIGREITMSAVREWAASQNGKVLEAVAVNNLGKWKTATQMIALTILLATRDSSIVGSHILVPSGVALLYISAGLALWSLAVYMRKIWTVLLKL